MLSVRRWWLAILLGIVGCVGGQHTESGVRDSSLATPATADVGSAIPDSMLDFEVLHLPVAPSEIVAANPPVPIDTQVCRAIVLAGIDRYADVGWVVPEVRVVASARDRAGYTLTPTGPDRVQFRARFRMWKSADDVAVQRRRQGVGNPRAGSDPLCLVPAALLRVAAYGIRRLAWLNGTLSAQIDVAGQKRDLLLDLRDGWTSPGGFLASIDLTRSDERLLRERLLSRSGNPVTFHIETRVRRSGCYQRVDLHGVDAIPGHSFKEGERVAIRIGALRAAIYRSGFRSKPDIGIEGECGDDSLTVPQGATDSTTMFSCTQTGTGVRCTFDGHFDVMRFKAATITLIGENAEPPVYFEEFRQ